jgi:uncharacterized protein with HEPN domain
VSGAGSDSRPDLDRVLEILDSIRAIERAEETVRRCAGDHDVARVGLDALRYRLCSIGVAVGSLSEGLREDHPAVAWSDLSHLGERIGADDDGLDPQTVRAAVDDSLRALRGACLSIVGESVRAGEDEP